MNLLKRMLITVSIVGNALFLALLFVTFSQNSNSLSVSLLDLDSASRRYATGACIVSVPVEAADLVFGPVEFSLKPGEQAALQYSLVIDKRQMNLSLELLYDRRILSIEQSGYGALLRALAPGETVLQVFTADGVRDVARITVAP